LAGELAGVGKSATGRGVEATVVNLELCRVEWCHLGFKRRSGATAATGSAEQKSGEDGDWR
jgi:hypothetical protein